MVEPLKLPCTENPEQDWATFTPHTILRRVSIDTIRVEVRDISSHNDGPSRSSYMNVAQARELFNWLGVYLHTYRKE